MWYLSSALTNTSSKSILNAYPKPITLTIVQFAFVALWCILFAYLAQTFPAVRNAIPALRYGIRPPTKEVISTTLPLALFQLGGHVLSSTATAKIPVSLVHTIKGLSPLFTVLAYRLLFGIHYTVSTYLSLIPLTLGVVLACSVEFSGNIAGVLCAFVAALIFVSQNIFSKKLFNEAARAEADGLPPSQQYPRKLDKLNLLCYCSGLAFLLTFPLWLWTEGFPLFADIYRSGSVSLSNSPTALDHGRLSLEFIFNGAFHFGQNILAFVLLSMVSPVTYSVASLIKRVFVIAISIVWFRNSMSRVQAVGIGLTFLGLYLYDRTHDAARAAKHLHRSQGTPLLPLDTDSRRDGATLTETPTDMNSYGLHTANGHAIGEEKKSDAAGPGRLGPGGWLPPGTKEKDTWRQSSSGNVSRSETAMNYT